MSRHYWKRRLPRLVVMLAVAVVVLSCGRRAGPATSEPRVVTLREQAPRSNDTRLATEWLLAELVSPGGEAGSAQRARRHADQLGATGMLAELGRGLDDALHGRPAVAADHLLAAAEAARLSTDPRASLIAWFSVRHAMDLKGRGEEVWERWRPFVERAIEQPRALGWRARSELLDWWANEAWAEASPDLEEQVRRQFGCLEHVRLAGPFGRGAAADSHRSFAAEAPGPWPMHWPLEKGQGEAPRVLKAEQRACTVSADEPAGSGIYYAESYVELPHETEVIVAVQGAFAVYVDDHLVLERDVREWGVWPRFGVRLRLGAGRHRVLARIGSATTSIRVLRTDGTPLEVASSADPAPVYSMRAPEVTQDPNDLAAFVRDGDVVDPEDDLTRLIAAYLAHVEGQDDVASVLIEPLVSEVDDATGPVLTLAALFAGGDPIFESGQAEDLVHELHLRAVAKDERLWFSQMSLALREGARKGSSEAVRRLEELAETFDRVPGISLALARLYGELGWTAEQRATVRALVDRFPDHLTALHAAVDVYEAEGDFETADNLIERIQKLERDSEIVLQRALAREDYDTALAELKRLAERRPERKDLAERIHDVMVRAGNTSEIWKMLEAAVETDPTDGAAWLALADARYATGKHGALRRALVDAVQNGADTRLLAGAIDLVEGMTELEPYRLSAKAIIEAYEREGRHMPGTAARVLDYAAIWVRSDGSSRMLEHEIIRLQSAEAIAQFAEHRMLEGLVLHMRVIKKDGRILEPEPVPGKPTVTFPHLEVGDYIETEQVVSFAGDARGTRYVGPRWFFREENVAYARSELVLVTPRSKNLIVETQGNVPEPDVQTDGEIETRRFRVDFSPAAPAEPQSPPITEFLPSVRVGWGIDLDERLRTLTDSLADVTPVDPRIARIARRIVEPAIAPRERARRLYRWVLDNVEDGQETDGRRVIVSKQGNRWRAFMTLCRALDIPVRYAVARSRLAPEPVGPISRAGLFSNPVLQVGKGRDSAWVTLSDKYAPFGYIPVEIRGMPAYLLEDEPGEPLRLPAKGSRDAVAFEGTVRLARDGSAKLEIVQRYEGKYAMALRQAISRLPERGLRDSLESGLLARALQGARLLSYEIDGRDDLDAPLAVRMQAEMKRFAHGAAGTLVIAPPFSPQLGRSAALPRRETPLLISEPLYREIALKVELPPGATVSGVRETEVRDGDRSVRVRDRVRGNVIELDRSIEVPAGRVQPDAYAEFARFARGADDALSREIRVKLPAKTKESAHGGD